MNYSENANNVAFIKKQVSSIAKASRVQINRLIGLTSMLENAQNSENREIISEVILTIYKLLSQNMNMMYLYMEELNMNQSSLISAELFLRSIIAECTKTLDASETNLQLDIKCEKSCIKIDEKAFILVIMNLLQNALLYSPPKTTVIVTLDNVTIDQTDYVSISVKNLSGLDGVGFARDKEECSGQGLFICMKAAETNGGKVEYIEEGGSITAKLLLPLIEESEPSELSSKLAEYISDKYTPVNLFMQEVLATRKAVRL